MENTDVVIQDKESGPFHFLNFTIAGEPEELSPANGNWDENFAIPINDPLVVSYGEHNQQITITNFSPCNLKDVVIYFTMPSMCGNVMYEIVRLELKALHRYVINTGVCDKDNETLFSVEVLDERYKKIRNIDTCWKVTIPNVATYGTSKTQTTTDITNIMTTLTNLAYTLQSEEMKTTLYNFEKIFGRKFRIYPEYKDDTGAGVPDYYNYPTNTPEEIMCIDLTKEEDMTRLLKTWGIGSKYYGGYQNRNTFEFGLIPQDSPKIGGGVTQTLFPPNWYRGLGHGVSIQLRETFARSEKGMILHNSLTHEMGHLLGFWHYGSMCYGEMIDHERVIETIAYLLGDELPYYDTLPDTDKVRCGGNKYEKYIIDNPDFIPKFYAKLSEEKDERNVEWDRVERSRCKTPDSFLSMMLGAAAALAAADKNLVASLHPADNITYNINGLTFSKFLKL